MSVTGLNTTALTLAQTGVTNINTSISALNAQLTIYSADLTTILNSANTNALLVDLVDQADTLSGLQSQIDGVTAQLKTLIGSLTIPT